MNENNLIIPFLSTVVVVLSATITFMVVQKPKSKVADAETLTTNNDGKKRNFDIDDVQLYGSDELDDDDDEFPLHQDLHVLQGQTKPAIDYNTTDTEQLIKQLQTLEEELTKSQSKNIELDLQIQLLKEQHNERVKLLQEHIKSLKSKHEGGKRRRSKTIKRRQN